MTFRPKAKDFKAPFLSGLCALFSVASFYFSSRVELYIIVYQLIAVVLAITALQIFLKYVQCDYVYKLSENALEIYKVSAGKSVCICSLSYEESLCEIVSSEEYNKNKSKYPKTQITTNYCKNIFPETYSLYFFNFNSKKAVLKFEPDTTFKDEFNKKINLALFSKETEENKDE